MNRKLNPFEEKINNYSVYELADWLYRCRNGLVVDETNIDTFPEKLKEYCDNWNNYREQNKKLFESKKFERAVIASAISRPTIILKAGKTKINITEQLYSTDTIGCMFFPPSVSTEDFVKTINDVIIKSMDEYIEVVEEIFSDTSNYKEKIANAIKYINTNKIMEFKYKEIEPEILKMKLSPKELAEEIKKFKAYNIKHGSYNLVDRLGEMEISKTVYFEWLDKAKEERDFNKSFFVNLSFLLSLPEKYVETLLNLNGYTLNGSLRMFDNIIATAFRCGYCQQHTQGLIEIQNDISKQMYGSNAKSLIPELYRNYGNKPKTK